MDKSKSVNIDPSEFLLTTTPTIEGYRITKTLEIVTAECVFGMSIFTDVFASVTDFFGGRSNKVQQVLRDARRVCLNELRKEAALVGGNAVVGVDLDYSEFSGQHKSMLFLVASGTAVNIKPGMVQSLLPSRPNDLQLSNSQCRLYLTEKYQIRRHEILGEFLAIGQLFSTLEKALEAVREEEMAEIDLESLRKEEWLRTKEEWLLTQQKSSESISKANLSDEDIRKMVEYNVEFDGANFLFHQYKYEKLADAIDYARKQK